MNRRHALQLFCLSALLVGVAVYLGSAEPVKEERVESGQELRAADEAPKAESRRPPPRRPLAKKGRAKPDNSSSRPPGTDCDPYVQTRCYGGNVHWFDSCGNVLELDQDCGTGFCSEGKCVDLNWVVQCNAPPRGRCEGDVLEICDVGRDLRIDCAVQGQICRRGPEGAACFTPDPVAGCRSGPPSCRGPILQRCERGSLRETDCRKLEGDCVEVPGIGATCQRTLPRVSPEVEERCGPCGCEPSGEASNEQCNGLDDDDNGFVDDAVSCGPVPLDVYVGTGALGERIIDRTGLEAELARVNDILAHSRSEIRFVLGELYDLDAPNPEVVTLEDLKDMVRAPAEATEASEFRAELVFVSRIVEGEAPRSGVALPFVTETCGEILHSGGKRFERSLVAVAVGRTPTTLAHELGHMLGLCHTHEENRPGMPPVAVGASGAQEPCAESCEYGGDAVCDTPLDAETCAYDFWTCTATCPGAEQPDTSNVMSYYHACRYQFSEDQVSLMEHTLALRRSWFSCRDARCECEPGAHTCPLGMSCRPNASGQPAFACGMDGPHLPGDSCRGQADCSGRSMCLTNGQRSRCIRPCIESSSGCTCVPVSQLALRVCEEDLAGND